MRLSYCTLLLILSIALGELSPAEESNVGFGGIWIVDIKGAIGPATSDYILRAFEAAQAADAKLIVLRMNTPGGLDNAMRDIIQAVLSSDIPVASYVGPKGARAASAGTYISYALSLIHI